MEITKIINDNFVHDSNYKRIYIKQNMDYKEKYEKILERARKELQACGSTDCDAARQIFRFFPELKESDDERIRKALIGLIKYLKPGRRIGYKFPIEFDKVLVWLEKQGKQEQTSEFNAVDWQPSKVDGKIHNIYNVGVEPKFQNGQWIVWQDKCYKVNYNGCGYELIDQNGLSTSLEYGTVDENAHLWTIADAKDGDILVDRFSTNSIIVLFKGINLNSSILVYCGYNGYSFSVKTDGLGYGRVDNTNYHPATKEQRVLFFQKMKEVGYEWDDKTKKLKKFPNALEECEIEHIEHGKYYYCIKDYYSGGCKRASKGEVVQALRGKSMMALGAEANKYFIPVKCIVNVSPAWSEEDEIRLDRICKTLWKNRNGDTDEIFQQEQDVDWLKSLKERMGGEV